MDDEDMSLTVLTYGAPCAHAFGFKLGGLRQELSRFAAQTRLLDAATAGIELDDDEGDPWKQNWDDDGESEDEDGGGTANRRAMPERDDSKNRIMMPGASSRRAQEKNASARRQALARLRQFNLQRVGRTSARRWRQRWRRP